MGGREGVGPGQRSQQGAEVSPASYGESPSFRFETGVNWSVPQTALHPRSPSQNSPVIHPEPDSWPGLTSPCPFPLLPLSVNSPGSPASALCHIPSSVSPQPLALARPRPLPLDPRLTLLPGLPASSPSHPELTLPLPCSQPSCGFPGPQSPGLAFKDRHGLVFPLLPCAFLPAGLGMGLPGMPCTTLLHLTDLPIQMQLKYLLPHD